MPAHTTIAALNPSTPNCNCPSCDSPKSAAPNPVAAPNPSAAPHPVAPHAVTPKAVTTKAVTARAFAPKPPGRRRARNAPPRSGQPHRLLTALFVTVAATLALAPTASAARPAETPCAQGSFCTWAGADFQAPVSTHTTHNVALERCVPLPPGREVHSFANRTGHPVTVYQDPDCSTNADFSTHPNGSDMPRAPYAARAITVWSH